jgi:hypothetical protein
MKRRPLFIALSVLAVSIGVVALSHRLEGPDAESESSGGLWSNWYQSISPDGVEAKATILANQAARSSDVTCAKSWHRFEAESDGLWQVLCYDWDDNLSAIYEVDLKAEKAAAVNTIPTVLPQ